MGGESCRLGCFLGERQKTIDVRAGVQTRHETTAAVKNYKRLYYIGTFYIYITVCKFKL